jgi:tellurite resistance protein
MILGLGGLSNGWRTAGRIWQAPAVVGDVLAVLTALIWATLLVLYVGKWFWARHEAIAEARHPVQGFFLALLPVSSMIVSIVLAPMLPSAAWALCMAGVAGQVVFSAYGMGGIWQGGRAPETTTPVLYMPTVGGGFVSAIALSAFGHADWGILFFGGGFISWIVLESLIIHRLMMLPELAPALRTTLGIHLAPPAVGCVAYLSVTAGPPDLMAQMLFGYALFQATIMIRLIPWLRAQPFTAGYWAYTFAVSALPLAALRFIEKGYAGPIAGMALPLFVAANTIIGAILIGTVALLVTGRLLPRTVAPAPAGE